MQDIACPGCGAPLRFKSAAAVLSVCEFCRTTVLKDAESVRDLGKMSEVLEDYTPLQIGSAGRYGQRSFTVVGRIQLAYSAGFWNEWYVLFDDASNGWLADASGQYTMTFTKDTNAALPLFEKLVPGRSITISGQPYTTADVRTARCTGGQGELPFVVGAGYETRAADLRAVNRFVTIDYSDAGAARVYVGEAVLLADLKLQLLRDPEALHDAAGRFRGKVSALECPACGAPVTAVPGFTVHLVCPSCHADVDTAGSVAKVLNAGAAVERVPLTLKLGAEASIEGARHTVLGAMRRRDTDGSAWTEYLCYAPGRPFLWLIETEDGWQRAQVLDRWPLWDGGVRVSWEGRAYGQIGCYTARVDFAAGAFNWRVRVGDTSQVTEFSQGVERLAAEASTEELTWSRALPLPLDQVRAWFGLGVHADRVPHPPHVDTARRILIALLLVNLIPLLFATGRVLIYVSIAAVAVYLPAYLLDRLDGEAS